PAIASITESGTCVPPGPSKKASGWRRAEKRARTASTSNATVDIADTLLRFVREPGDEGACRSRHRDRPRRPVERRRSERRSQHVRARSVCPVVDTTGRLIRAGYVARQPHPPERARNRVVGSQGGCGALLGPAPGVRPHHGAAGTRLTAPREGFGVRSRT